MRAQGRAQSGRPGRHRVQRRHGRFAVSTLAAITTASPLIAPTALHASPFTAAAFAATTTTSTDPQLAKDTASWSKNEYLYPDYSAGTNYGADENDINATNVSTSNIGIQLNWDTSTGFSVLYTLTDPTAFVDPSDHTKTVDLQGIHFHTTASAPTIRYQLPGGTSTDYYAGIHDMTGNPSFDFNLPGAITRLANADGTCDDGSSDTSDDSSNIFCFNHVSGFSLTFYDSSFKKGDTLSITTNKSNGSGGTTARTLSLSGERAINALRTSFDHYLGDNISSLNPKPANDVTAKQLVDAITSGFDAYTDKVLNGTEQTNTTELTKAMADFYRAANVRDGSASTTGLTAPDTVKKILQDSIPDSVDPQTKTVLELNINNINSSSKVSDLTSTASSVAEAITKAENTSGGGQNPGGGTNPGGEDIKSVRDRALAYLGRMSFLNLGGSNNYQTYKDKIDADTTTAAITKDLAEAMALNVQTGNENGQIKESKRVFTAYDTIRAFTSIDQVASYSYNYEGPNNSTRTTTLAEQYMDVNKNSLSGSVKSYTEYMTESAFTGRYFTLPTETTTNFSQAVEAAKTALNKDGATETDYRLANNALSIAWFTYYQAFRTTLNSTATEIIRGMSFVDAKDRAEAYEEFTNQFTAGTDATDLLNIVRDLEVKNLTAGNQSTDPEVSPKVSQEDIDKLAATASPSLNTYLTAPYSGYQGVWKNTGTTLVQNSDTYKQNYPYTLNPLANQQAYDNAIEKLRTLLNDKDAMAAVNAEDQLKEAVQGVQVAQKALSAFTDSLYSNIEKATDEQKDAAKALLARMTYLTPTLRDTASTLIGNTVYTDELLAVVAEISRLNIAQGNLGLGDYAAVEKAEQLSGAESITSLDLASPENNPKLKPYFDYYTYQKEYATNNGESFKQSPAYTGADEDQQKAYDTALSALVSSTATDDATLKPLIDAYTEAKKTIEDNALNEKRSQTNSLLRRMSFLTTSQRSLYRGQVDSALTESDLLTILQTALNADITAGNSAVPADKQLTNTETVSSLDSVITAARQPYFDYYHAALSTELGTYDRVKNSNAYKNASLTARSAYDSAYTRLTDAVNATLGRYEETDYKYYITTFRNLRAALSTSALSSLSITTPQILASYINRMSFLSDSQRASYQDQALRISTDSDALAVAKSALRDDIANGNADNSPLPADSRKGNADSVTSLNGLISGVNAPYFDYYRGQGRLALNHAGDVMIAPAYYNGTAEDKSAFDSAVTALRTVVNDMDSNESSIASAWKALTSTKLWDADTSKDNRTQNRDTGATGNSGNSGNSGTDNSGSDASGTGNSGNNGSGNSGNGTGSGGNGGTGNGGFNINNIPLWALGLPGVLLPVIAVLMSMGIIRN
ncbi:MAG: hypothetical protein Q3962_07135 [Corynebacterium sp.]|nr:hypothetical protein [Corynebacterium sp.]